MREQIETNSYKLNQLEACLDFTGRISTWQAGDGLGLALEDEVKETEAIEGNILNESSTPLFIKDSPEGNKGNAQDEKDEMEE